ncbi:MAG TPA: tyrosine-type recombinase/integrase [Terriglobales bacterium]
MLGLALAAVEGDDVVDLPHLLTGQTAQRALRHDFGRFPGLGLLLLVFFNPVAQQVNVATQAAEAGDVGELAAVGEARDRVLFTLDMTWPFRPSELFALRWKNFHYEERTLAVTQTAYKGKLRDWGKTPRALRTVTLPEGLANDLWLWRQECPDPSPEAFIFATQRKSQKTKQRTFISTDNYRRRVMKRLAEELKLPKLTFQVLRRSIATLAQKKGSLKDVQGILGHDKIETTGNVYVQELTESVLKTVGLMCEEQKARPGLLQ